MVVVLLFIPLVDVFALDFENTADSDDEEVVTYLGDGVSGYKYIGNSYDVNDKSKYGVVTNDDRTWVPIPNNNGYTLTNNHLGKFADKKVRVPNCFIRNGKRTYVTEISGSCSFKEFDIDPKSQYLKLVDNVVFSKDGKILMSYAWYDPREIYEIPEGTEIIKDGAFANCSKIKHLIIPESVKEIGKDAFREMYNLETINLSSSVEVLDNTFLFDRKISEVYIPQNSKLKEIKGQAFIYTNISELTLPSFDIKIGCLAFPNSDIGIKLKSYVKPEVISKKLSNNSCRIKWDKIPNASYYEVYKMQKDGSYKLFKTVRRNSLKINGLKSGKTYTYAVKPVAVIEAVGDSTYGGNNQYIIEGTMSEDVTIEF